MRPKIDLKAMAARELQRAEQLREAAELRRSRRLCSSPEWCHGTTVDHHHKTVTLEVFRRVTKDGYELEYHERSGQTWAFSTEAELDQILIETDRIGIEIGSLVIREQ